MQSKSQPSGVLGGGDDPFAPSRADPEGFGSDFDEIAEQFDVTGQAPPANPASRRKPGRLKGVTVQTLTFVPNNTTAHHLEVQEQAQQAAQVPAAPTQSATSPPAPLNASQQLREIDEAELKASPPQGFLGNQAVFRDQFYRNLPAYQERIHKFLMAQPQTVITPNGTLTQILPDDVAMTKGQADLMKVVMSKVLPTMAPLTQAGDDQAQGDTVNITINTVGGPLDLSKVPGVEGIADQARARQVGKLTFNVPGESDDATAIIDAEAVEVPTQAPGDEERVAEETNPPTAGQI